MDNYTSTKQAARILGVDPRTLKKHAETVDIRRVRVGKRWRWNVADLRATVAQCAEGRNNDG